MSEVKHTPTPWTYHDLADGYGQERFDVVGSDGISVADEQGTFDKASADHIVKCVNLHDELVGALKLAVTEVSAERFLPDGRRLLDVVREALKKAGAL